MTEFQLVEPVATAMRITIKKKREAGEAEGDIVAEASSVLDALQAEAVARHAHATATATAKAGKAGAIAYAKRVKLVHCLVFASLFPGRN